MKWLTYPNFQVNPLWTDLYDFLRSVSGAGGRPAGARAGGARGRGGAPAAGGAASGGRTRVRFGQLLLHHYTQDVVRIPHVFLPTHRVNTIWWE